jgi:DNA-directed RNA polymerase specialized sigma24 family protein
MTSELLKGLDPTTFALAEEQAGAAGISLGEHIERLILDWTRREQKAADATTRTLLQISSFYTRIDFAAVLLSTAFVEGAVTDFAPPKKSRTTRKRHGSTDWYFEVIDHCIERSREVRNALVHQWHPTARADHLAMEAFMLLTQLTPSGSELVRVCQYDRPKAFSEMAKALDVITQQIEQSANLIVEVEAGEELQPTEEKQFDQYRAALLDKAGGGLSLTEAAKLLGLSRQAVHKRIKTNSVLGMMNGTELVLPRAQFTKIEGQVEVLPGIAEVLKQFKMAGNWSALQFLVESDPNLADIPLHALAEGRTEDVCHAAKAYLGIDED